jgi:hypothetical protein
VTDPGDRRRYRTVARPGPDLGGSRRGHPFAWFPATTPSLARSRHRRSDHEEAEDARAVGAPASTRSWSTEPEHGLRLFVKVPPTGRNTLSPDAEHEVHHRVRGRSGGLPGTAFPLSSSIATM